MKGKGFKFHVAKEMPSQPKLVSQKKLNGRIGPKSQRMPEPRDPWDAQHNPNKITTVEKDKRVSST